MKKNVWFIMGGAMLITTVLMPVIQGYMLMSTPTPVFASNPTLTSKLSLLSPDAGQRQLGPLGQPVQEFGEQGEQMTLESWVQDECPYVTHSRPEVYWIPRIDTGDMILGEGYAPIVNLATYDLDDDGRPEILKWDLGRDGQFEIIECEVDGDGLLDYVLVDLNGNGQFDNEEIYLPQDAARRWQPLFPGALPFPFLSVFPG